ncbi:sugar transferase [Apilactobacillus nanyangensis]|uniref:Sugar transferase n=1 Tax=Apilactobacillus nanyangensis TaxID=2799579 RepID=A0ABT0HYA2_9LACO|nr:sugar transferase [Apilactobacillus nanyangensis]MCK8611896.1 sugar transferase [Apilactobacillus nanyangensis]
MEKIDYRFIDYSKRYLFFKRVLDIIVSLLGIIISLPITIFVIIAIKIEDGGPIFYAQKRVGKGKTEFLIFKFRSMVIDADKVKDELMEQNEIDGAMFKMAEDPRITKVGRFIRKHSIDEIPQLMNVLIGDMSIVGPRPPLPEEVAKYTEHDLKRLCVKPGCTGLWQVSGRNSLNFDEMVNLDMTYIKNASMSLDLKICFKTILIMIWPNDAY